MSPPSASDFFPFNWTGGGRGGNFLYVKGRGGSLRLPPMADFGPLRRFFFVDDDALCRPNARSINFLLAPSGAYLLYAQPTNQHTYTYVQVQVLCMCPPQGIK
jgi:hypothetical protein